MDEDTQVFAGNGIRPERVAQTEAKDEAILKYLRQDFDKFHERVVMRLDGFPDRDEHWLWHGNMHEAGYGVGWLPQEYGGASFMVHRAMAIWRLGSLPPHLVVDHDTNGCPRNCANPYHMTILSQGENMVMHRRRQTHCGYGHELSGDNVYGDSKHRQCKTCMQRRSQEQYSAIRLAAAALGMKVSHYIKQYGKSQITAKQILADHA